MPLDDLFSPITPARTLGIRAVRFEHGELELTAPLALNLNDKGTAFAGSISSMLALAGWGVITQTLRDAGIEAEVLAVTSCIDYTDPVAHDFRALAELPAPQADRILRELNARGRSRIRLEARLESNGVICACMSTSYAVRRKKA